MASNMTRKATFAFAFLFVLACLAAAWSQAPAPKGPPKTRTDNVKDVLHGVEIVDPYRWLEEQNSPETRAWIDAQNAYTDAVLSAVPGRAELKPRLAELMKIDTMSMPTVRADRYFFTKRTADQDLFVLYVRKGLRGKDEVLIDPHPLSPDHKVSMAMMGVSKDGTLLAYGIRQGGQDEVELHLMDVDTRKDLADQFPRARYMGASFKPDKSGFYYGKFTPQGSRIYYHALGGDPSGDAEIFGKGYAPDKIVSGSLSENGRWLIIHVSEGAAGNNQIFYQDAGKQGPITPLITDQAAHFRGWVGDDTLLVTTDWKAPKGRVLAIDLKDPAPDKWREIISESSAVLEGVSPAGGRLLAHYTENALSQLKLFTASGRFIREIKFPALGTVGGSGRWESDEAFISFNSFHVPTTSFRYDLAKDTREVWFQPKIPIDSERFTLKQVWYTSKDSTRVPMFLLHRKDLKLDGSSPVFLTGYGGFRLSTSPAYAARAVVWAEKGGVYAVANLRGGGEFGEEWHRAGMFEKKQNVFDDFIAAAEWLVKNGYTRPSKIAISGTSNGGLLVGAALTERPDLFGAVACGYPLLDMVRYHKFSVARWWVSEYGSAEDPEQFKYIFAYSPYHHVKPGTKYPAVLFISGDGDTRVDPLHARKMAALVQASTASDRPVLLRYDTKAGHSGGKPQAQLIDEAAEELAFLLWQTK
jgi:prolyl oligopeptidase